MSDVFDGKNLPVLPGNIAIGHVRYASKQGTSGLGAHPVVVSHGGRMLALCFNGRLTNSAKLRSKCEMSGGLFQTTGDAEVIMHTLVRELLDNSGDIEKAALSMMGRLEGAWSILILTGDKLIAARDPHGFRPLSLGDMDGDMVFASESCAFDAVGAKLVRDINPGECCIAGPDGLKSIKSGLSGEESLCVFEFVYNARVDSVIGSLSVDMARREAGCCLAREDDVIKAARETGGLEDYIVVGVPDSALSAALGYAMESGLPYEYGLVKNRYVGRTFILDTQGTREQAVRLKLSALRSCVAGKRVILVDDSIVRGTTSGYVVTLLREAGATEVHMRISSPPFLYPCHFGTDVPDRAALIAANHTVDEIAVMLGVDSLRYLSAESLKTMVGGLTCGYCDGCFTGKYSVEV